MTSHASTTEVLTDVTLLDGGLATHLESRGQDLSGHLWSAGLMLSDPGAIAAAQRDFLAAGADVVTTMSYQASRVGFAALGLSATDVDALLRTDARRAREVATTAPGRSSRQVLVVGSVGPYGAMLNDGSEYRGDYDVSPRTLREFHAARLAVLAEECDVVLLETIPQLREVEVLLGLVADSPLPVWLSVSAVGDRLRSGESAAEAFAMAADCSSVTAVGANCIDPADAASLAHLAAHHSGKTALMYPNSGESWDAGEWSGAPTAPTDVTEWVAAGARIVGGCCRVSPAHIQAMATSLGR